MFKFDNVHGIVYSHSDSVLGFDPAGDDKSVAFWIKSDVAVYGGAWVEWLRDSHDRIEGTDPSRITFRDNKLAGNNHGWMHFDTYQSGGTSSTKNLASSGKTHTNGEWCLFGWTWDLSGTTLKMFAYDPGASGYFSWTMTNYPDVALDIMLFGQTCARIMDHIPGSYYTNSNNNEKKNFSIGGITVFDGVLSDANIATLWNSGDFTYFRDNASNVPSGWSGPSVTRCYEFNGDLYDTTGANELHRVSPPDWQDSSDVFGGTWPTSIDTDMAVSYGLENFGSLLSPPTARPVNFVITTSDSYEGSIWPYINILGKELSSSKGVVSRNGSHGAAQSATGLTNTSIVGAGGVFESGETRTTDGSQVSYADNEVVFDYLGDLLPVDIDIRIGASTYLTITAIEEDGGASGAGYHRVTARTNGDPSITTGQSVYWYVALPVQGYEQEFSSVADDTYFFAFSIVDHPSFNTITPGTSWSLVSRPYTRKGKTGMRCAIFHQLASSSDKQVDTITLKSWDEDAQVVELETVTDIWADAIAGGAEPGDIVLLGDFAGGSAKSSSAATWPTTQIQLYTNGVTSGYFFPRFAVWYDPDDPTGNVYLTLGGGSWSNSGYNPISGSPKEKHVSPREMRSLLKALNGWMPNANWYNLDCIHDPNADADDQKAQWEERLSDWDTLAAQAGISRFKFLTIEPTISGSSGDNDVAGTTNQWLQRAIGTREAAVENPGRIGHIALSALVGWAPIHLTVSDEMSYIFPQFDIYQRWSQVMPLSVGPSASDSTRGWTYTDATKRLDAPNNQAIDYFPEGEHHKTLLVLIGGDSAGNTTPGWYEVASVDADNDYITLVDSAGLDATGVEASLGPYKNGVYGDGTHPETVETTTAWAFLAYTELAMALAGSSGLASFNLPHFDLPKFS